MRDHRIEVNVNPEGLICCLLQEVMIIILLQIQGVFV